MFTVTGAPVKLAVNESRQQSGKASFGKTVGRVLYSVPGSSTVTVTGPGSTSVGVNVSAHVEGCPTAELEFQAGGAKVHEGREAANCSLQVASSIATCSEDGGELYLPALTTTGTLDTGGAAITKYEP